jgi:D-galactarolactone cycloisomerase
MKVKEVRVLPLTGATPDGGWEQGYADEENLHTLWPAI